MSTPAKTTDQILAEQAAKATGKEPAVSEGEAKRVSVKYNATLNYKALKEQEGHIFSNFLELVYKVILIDEKPFDTITYKNAKKEITKLKLTSGRKNEFLFIIREYAILDFIGMKCHVVAVLDEETKKEINDQIKTGFKESELEKHLSRIKYK